MKPLENCFMLTHLLPGRQNYTALYSHFHLRNSCWSSLPRHVGSAVQTEMRILLPISQTCYYLKNTHNAKTTEQSAFQN